MALTEMVLKETYDSDEDDILHDFYIPVLSQSVRYDRLAGYFSSTALAISARGMAQFLRNGGKMRLVTSVQITTEDQKAIKEGLDTPENIISRTMEEDLDIVDRLKKDHVAALAWMLAKETLEIKIVVPLSTDGLFHTDELDYNSIYHQKIGILHDKNSNIVTFSGSVNETGKAWYDNVEEFKVFCSWKDGQDKYGSEDVKRFEKFWYGQSSCARVFDLPTAVRERLIRYTPVTEDDAVARLNGEESIPILRNYQSEAIEKWNSCGRRGILEMATGTGKTRTAIACIRQMLDAPNKAPILVIITCPYVHLVRQWVKELKNYGIKSREVHSEASSSQTYMLNSMRKLNDKIMNSATIVTTHDTFSSKRFIECVKKCKVKTLVVADEVHRLGTKNLSKGLIDTYENRLGLSATPRRYFDDIGTDKIFDYFNGVVYEFGLDEAIEGGYLSQYDLFPHAAYLSRDEMGAYGGYSQRIAIEYAKEKPDHELLKNLTLRRARIVRDAHSKLDKFEEILTREGELDHCLVYCSDQQINHVESMLHNRGVTYHRFTYEEDQDMREKLLDDFARGDISVLVAMKCLDMGVDIPSTKTAIILASSRNPAEFVQRRGRILRPDNKKACAAIHDILALPSSIPTDKIYAESEKRVITNEISRLQEFARSSNNPEYSDRLMHKLSSQYKIEGYA